MSDTIIYIRTSTEEQHPENQIKDCKTLVSGEFELIEDKQSAWKEEKERDGFNKVKKLIKSNKIKHFIVWDLDRIYRNRQKLKEFFTYCKLYKCSIHSFRQEWLEEMYKMPEPFNEIMHDLMLNIMGWIAQDESDKKSQRVKAAMRTTKKGVYSYKGNKWGRRELSTQAIKKIINLRKQGKTMREISNLVQYSDRSNHMKNVSIGVVHKILSGTHRKNKIVKKISQESN